MGRIILHEGMTLEALREKRFRGNLLPTLRERFKMALRLVRQARLFSKNRTAGPKRIVLKNGSLR